MWKFPVLSASQILREIKIGHLDATKIAILTIWAALNSDFWEVFDIFKYEFFLKNQNSKPPILLKRHFLTFWNYLELISRKIRMVAGKLLTFLTVDYLYCIIPIRLPTSVKIFDDQITAQRRKLRFFVPFAFSRKLRKNWGLTTLSLTIKLSLLLHPWKYRINF